MSDPWKEGCERCDPAFLCPPADDPENLALERGERFLGRVRVRRFRVVHEQHFLLTADFFETMREARESRKPSPDRFRRKPERQSRRDDGGRVLRVMTSAQRADSVKIGDWFRVFFRRVDDARAVEKKSGRD